VNLRVIHTGEGTPQFAWTAEHMRKLALAMRAHLVRRTFDLGIGADGKPMKPYSTRPITIAFDSETGRRLKPKGGQPAYGAGLGTTDRTSFDNGVTPERPVNRRADRGFSFIFREAGDTGDTGRKTRGAIIGRHYEGGYAEYKASSRRGLVNRNGVSGVAVDLTLSGRLSRSVRVISSTRTQATIGITGEAQVYGARVDGDRQFMGFSEADHAEGQLILSELMAMAQRKAAGGSRGSL